jgi:hypothetical protein
MILAQPKGIRDGYAPQPFFFAEKNDCGDVRLVAWTGSQRAQRAAFEAIVQLMPEYVEIILKVKVAERDPDDDDDDGRLPWQRFHGVAANGALLEAMSRCEAFVFRDSRSQICVRNPHTLEYAVFDDDGVIYVYSGDERFRELLSQAGFEERVEELIGRRGWWGQFPPDGPNQGAEFIRLMRLTPSPSPGDSYEARLVH